MLESFCFVNVEQGYSIALPFPPSWPHYTALLPILSPLLSDEQQALLKGFGDSLQVYSRSSAGTPVYSESDTEAVTSEVIVGGDGSTAMTAAESAHSLSVDIEGVRAIGTSRIKPVKAAAGAGK